MSDEADRASDEEEIARQSHLIASQRTRERPPADFDNIHCVEEDCGIELPKLRIDYGCFRCVDCQTLIENRKRKQGL